MPASLEGPIPTPAIRPSTGLDQHSPSDFLDQTPGVSMEESPPHILSTKNFHVTQLPHRKDESVSGIIWDCWSSAITAPLWKENETEEYINLIDAISKIFHSNLRQISNYTNYRCYFPELIKIPDNLMNTQYFLAPKGSSLPAASHYPLLKQGHLGWHQSGPQGSSDVKIHLGNYSWKCRTNRLL